VSRARLISALAAPALLLLRPLLALALVLSLTALLRWRLSRRRGVRWALLASFLPIGAIHLLLSPRGVLLSRRARRARRSRPVLRLASSAIPALRLLAALGARIGPRSGLLPRLTGRL
jgi:hypothetical protein